MSPTVAEVPPAENRKNFDIQCLKCGAMNIVENRVCGRCGANLPVVYDEAGNLFRWNEAQGYEEVMKTKPATRPGPHLIRTGWILRFGVILFSLLVAWLILRHR